MLLSAVIAQDVEWDTHSLFMKGGFPARLSRVASILLSSKTAMATNVSAAARSQSSSFPTMVLIAGWLIPGAGHLMQRKWIRGSLLMVSIIAMFVIGLALKGKIYSPNTGDLLDILNFAGDLGNGLLYVLARLFDLGQAAVQVATADYGTKFIVVAGLLNVIAAVDAHSLATGRKRS
jgi:hypothetical protein